MPVKPANTIDLIAACAGVPCFTTYEDRLHPLIRDIAGNVPGVQITRVPQNNLILSVPGDVMRKPVALTAHLDKINHFGEHRDSALPVSISRDKITGQLDDTVGVGLCLSMMLQSDKRNFPPLYLLLSEVEEGTGLKEHPQWLRNGGEGYHHGIGAERISAYLQQQGIIPGAVITIDTTPLFRGNPGLAIYTNHWEKNGLAPSPELVEATEALYAELVTLQPAIERHNNTNDYLTYGLELNRGSASPVVSIALEPAIYPYHQAGEEVFLSDIAALEELLVAYLQQSK